MTYLKTNLAAAPAEERVPCPRGARQETAAPEWPATDSGMDSAICGCATGAGAARGGEPAQIR